MMKKRIIQTIFIMCFMLLGVRANAALSTTFTWDIPGSVELFVGSTDINDKAQIPEGTTTYTVTIDNTWGNTYIGCAEGYFLIDAIDSEGNTYSVSPVSKKILINMAQCDGKTIKINCAKIEYDATIELNVINGRNLVSCTLGGTDRTIKLKTGVQTINYSSEFENTITFFGKLTNTEEGAYYLKKNGEIVDWSVSFGNVTVKNLPIANGDELELKFSNVPDPEEAPTATISLNFTSPMAKDALIFIYNTTKRESINDIDSFTVEEGDEIRFMFNTKDYNVTFDGTLIEPSPSEPTTSKVISVDGDCTIAISAEERTYGTVNIVIEAADIDGLVLREGTYNGNIIDKSRLSFVGNTSYTFHLSSGNKTVDLQAYSVSVSQKDPKVFVSAKEGYWIEASEYVLDGETMPVYVGTPNYTLKVLNHKITADNKLIVFVSVDKLNANVENIKLRDSDRNTIELTEGYNVFEIDPSFSSPFTVVSQNLNESVPFSFYCNGSLVSADDNGLRTVSINNDAIFHIFAGKRAPSQRTITAEITDNSSEYEIIVDRFHKLTPENPTAKTFNGCEVSVTPGTNDYLLDGAKPDYDGDTHVFIVTADHEIKIIGNTGSVEAIFFPGNINVTVATLDGKIVMKNADTEKLLSLPHGIYIINGKKVMVN